MLQCQLQNTYIPVPIISFFLLRLEELPSTLMAIVFDYNIGQLTPFLLKYFLYIQIQFLSLLYSLFPSSHPPHIFLVNI